MHNQSRSVPHLLIHIFVGGALLACDTIGKLKAEEAPVSGGSCKTEGTTKCGGADNMLACQGGTWRPFPCKGANGCSGNGQGNATCDISGNGAGDSCTSSEEGKQLCGTGKQRLTCQGGKIKSDACGGPKGCYLAKDVVTCDTTISMLGTECPAEKDTKVACSPDQKSRALCKNGQWTLLDQCQGPEGCYFDDLDCYCDQTVARLGDACPDAEGRAACSDQGKAILQCENGKFAFKSYCAGNSICRVKGSFSKGATFVCE
jgi:hypothetical protein